MFVFALALVAKFQPYKHKRSNTVDIMLLLLMINVNTMQYAYVGRFVYLKVLERIVLVIFSLIILSYQAFLILACVWPKAILWYCKKCKTHLMSKIRMSEVNEGDRALLNPESTDYNSCQ